MLSDLDEPVHLRREHAEWQNLWRRAGAGSDHPKTDRRLQGDGRLRFCRAVFGAARRLRRCSPAPATLLAVLTLLGASAGAETPPATTTPIQHLIVVVGENLSFDNLFGGYEPRPGAIVHNL